MATISLPGLFDWTQVKTPAPPDALHNPQGAQLFLDQNPEFDNRIAPITTQPVGGSTDFVGPNPERAARIAFLQQLEAEDPDALAAAGLLSTGDMRKAAVAAIQQNPELMWQDPRWIQGLSPDQQWAAFQQYNEGFQTDRDTWGPRGKNFGTVDFAQNITDMVTANHDDPNRSNTDLLGGDWINDFVWGVHTLFANDPEGFLEWEKNNPEMAVRWHAQMGERFGGESNTSKWGVDKFNHNERARAIAYQLSQDRGWGEDGKNNGQIIAPNYKTLDDVSNKSGSSDFWKIGTPQSITDGLFNYIEDNPWEAAGTIAAIAAAPYVSNLVGGGALGAMAGGATASGGASLAQGGDLGDVVGDALSGAGMAYAGGLLGDIIETATGFMPPDMDPESFSGFDAYSIGRELYGNYDNYNQFNPSNPYPDDPGHSTGPGTWHPVYTPPSDAPAGGGGNGGGGPSGQGGGQGTPDGQVPGGGPATDTGADGDILPGQLWDLADSETDPNVREILIGEYEDYTGNKFEDGRPDSTGDGEAVVNNDSPADYPEDLQPPEEWLEPGNIWVWGDNGWEQRARGDDDDIFSTPFDLSIPGGILSDIRWNPGMEPGDYRTPGFGDDIPGNGGGTGGGSGSGDGTGDGDGSGSGSGETSIVESLFSAPLTQSMTDLFAYTRLSPAQAARLPVPINYVKGLFS